MQPCAGHFIKGQVVCSGARAQACAQTKKMSENFFYHIFFSCVVYAKFFLLFFLQNSLCHLVVHCGQVIGTACVHLKRATTQSVLLIGCHPNRKCDQVQLWAEVPPSEQHSPIPNALRLRNGNSVGQSVVRCGQVIGTACANRYCAAARSS